MKLSAPKLAVLSLVLIYSLAGFGTLASPSGQGVTMAPSAERLPPEDPWISKSIEVAVNQYDKSHPALAYNSKQHDYLVVWEQYIKVGESAIYARRVSDDGKPKDSAFPIMHVTGKEFKHPDVVYQPGQDMFWIYYTYMEDSTTHNLMLSWLPGKGDAASNFVFSHDWPRNWYPALTYNKRAGELLVVYEKYLESFSRTIEADVLKPSPLERLAEIDIAGVFPEMRRFPDVVYNQVLDHYLAAYTRQVPYDAKSQAIGKLISGDRDWFSKEYTLKENQTADQDDLSLTAGKDEFLAVWHEINEGAATSGIWGRRITRDGPAGVPIDISYDLNEKRYEPDTAYNSLGYYLVVWRNHIKYNTQTYQRIYGGLIQAGQDTLARSEFRIESGGSILTSESEYRGYGPSKHLLSPQDDPVNQKRPAVACSQSTACLVVFEVNDPGPFYNIHGYLVGLHQRSYLPVVINK